MKAWELSALLRGMAPPIKEAIAKAVAEVRAEAADDRRRILALEQRGTLEYLGVWDGTRRYERGQFVTHDGSVWACRQATMTMPGTPAGANAWTLAVKRGRDARPR